jgi:hypothetical protein
VKTPQEFFAFVRSRVKEDPVDILTSWIDRAIQELNQGKATSALELLGYAKRYAEAMRPVVLTIPKVVNDFTEHMELRRKYLEAELTVAAMMEDSPELTPDKAPRVAAEKANLVRELDEVTQFFDAAISDLDIACAG